jgi:hypothetical protein
MNASARGLVLAVLHLALVAALGGKLLLDRARYPRVWVKAAPVDPELPIRGRYLRLRVEPPGAAGEPQVLAFYLPERGPDPGRRPRGEELWAEVTVVPHGPLRPIRLGVKRHGRMVPLAGGPGPEGR